MPRVFLPALRWVTWRIASSFADRERTSSFCRFFTRAPSPAFAARKIRFWMRRTTASAAAQSTSDHTIGSRPSVCSAFAIQRLRSVLTSSSLASAETRRKSAPFRAGYFPLSRALSPPLQRSLRFLRHPLPPPPSPFLAVGLPPCGGTGGAYPVAQWGVATGAV